MAEQHTDFTVHDSSLVNSCEWQYIGASLDGIVNCACCGTGALEIKCPYCHGRDSIADAAATNQNFCLNVSSSGLYYLDQTHSFHYQVQTQLFVVAVEYCDFFVCTFTDDEESELFIECVIKTEGIQNQKSEAHIFAPSTAVNDTQCPSVTYDSQCTTSSATSEIQRTSSATSNSQCTSARYCYCAVPEEGTVIACENKTCAIG